MKLLIRDMKSEKSNAPLVDNDQLAPATAPEDVEGQAQDTAHFFILRARARRVSTTTTLCLLLTALLVVGTGIIGGTYFYRQYLRTQIFKGWCTIPYDATKSDMFLGSKLRDEDVMLNDDDFMNALPVDDDSENFSNMISRTFAQKFELDLANQEYEKIDVPDFREGRGGRFVHDFNVNKTGIVDVAGKRCFVMPLNRDNVLPPKTLSDLIEKMWQGYYKVDTDTVRETMRVVTPPVTDMDEVGTYIANECNSYPIYKLEQYVGGVVKRSADLGNEAKFAQFSGKGILEIDIVNMKDVEPYEHAAE